MNFWKKEKCVRKIEFFLNYFLSKSYYLSKDIFLCFSIQGTQFWMTCLSFILVVPITSILYLPVFMKLRLTSSYEYLHLRFNQHCRLLASALYMLQMVLYTSVAVYAPALALSHGEWNYIDNLHLLDSKFTTLRQKIVRCIKLIIIKLQLSIFIIVFKTKIKSLVVL